MVLRDVHTVWEYKFAVDDIVVTQTQGPLSRVSQRVIRQPGLFSSIPEQGGEIIQDFPKHIIFILKLFTNGSETSKNEGLSSRQGLKIVYQRYWGYNRSPKILSISLCLGAENLSKLLFL